MQYSLRAGRLGSLTIYLNYTWLFALVLGLWWLALLWLPDHLPGWQGRWYWLAAVTVLALYFFSVIVHELIHSAIARTGPRLAVLYPTGAAQPFRLDQVDAGRGVVAALAAPMFNTLLGGLLVILTSGIQPGNFMADVTKGILEPLGWLNLALGLLNFIPGIPFDGGWALSAGVFWFNGDRESGLSLARSVGGVVALALGLLGAWRGLTTNSWIEALALVLVGWVANEAGALSRSRSLLRNAFSEIKAQDLMNEARPGDHIHENESVAALVKAHPRFPPGDPIAVMDAEEKMVGLVTLQAADALLQGNWASTPVRSITTSMEEARTLTPTSSLNEAVELFAQRPPGASEDASLPVVENGVLVGSLSPARVSTFQNLAREFGIEESLAERGAAPMGFAGLLGRFLPAIILITLLAILGNIALRTNPAEIRKSTDEKSEAPIVFSNFQPPDDAIVGEGAITISVDMSAPSAVTTATLTLDGTPLEAILSQTSPLSSTVSATLPGLTQGPHEVEVTASLESGRSKRAEWQFRVTFRGGEESPTALPTPSGEIPAQEPPQFSRQSPPPGSQALAGGPSLEVSVALTSSRPIAEARVLFDGAQIPSQVNPAPGKENSYVVRATVREIAPGEHNVQVEAGGATASWGFTALQPDAQNVYFEQTGVFLSEPFLSYWNANGGLALFGYPISIRLEERVPGTAEVYTAQYFERARFELHAATGDQVLLGRLGALVHQPDPPAQPLEGAQFFPETGHNLRGDFLEFWNRQGGLAVFGYPISEEISERSAADGKEYTVQYFERNRFELHPDAPPEARVQLGLLGSEIYRRVYVVP